MPSLGETTNTAEYTALLLGVRAAMGHGVKRLRVEGDNLLVLRQVRVILATKKHSFETLTQRGEGRDCASGLRHSTTWTVRPTVTQIASLTKRWIVGAC